MAFTESQIIQAGGAVNNNKSVQAAQQQQAPNPANVRLQNVSYAAAVQSESTSANYNLLPSDVSFPSQQEIIGMANAKVSAEWTAYTTSSTELNSLVKQLGEYLPSKNGNAQQLLSEYISQLNAFNAQSKQLQAQEQVYNSKSATAISIAGSLRDVSGSNEFMITAKGMPFYKSGETYQQFLNSQGFFDVSGKWEFEPQQFQEIQNERSSLIQQQPFIQKEQSIVSKIENIYNNQYLPAVNFFNTPSWILQNATDIPSALKSYNAVSVISSLSGTSGSVINVGKNGLMQITPMQIPALPNETLSPEGKALTEADLILNLMSSNSNAFTSPSASSILNAQSSTTTAVAKNINASTQTNALINQQLAQINKAGTKYTEEAGIIGAGVVASVLSFGAVSPLLTGVTGSILLGSISAGAVSGAVGSTASLYAGEAFGNRYTLSQAEQSVGIGALSGAAIAGTIGGVTAALKGIPLFNSFETPEIVQVSASKYTGMNVEYAGEVYGNTGSMSTTYNVIRSNGEVLDTLKMDTYVLGGKGIPLEAGGYQQNVLARIYIESAQNGYSLDMVRGPVLFDSMTVRQGDNMVSIFKTMFTPESINGNPVSGTYSYALGEMAQEQSFKSFIPVMKAMVTDSVANGDGQFLDFNELANDLDNLAIEKDYKLNMPTAVNAKLNIVDENGNPLVSFRGEVPNGNGMLITNPDQVVQGVFLQGFSNKFMFLNDIQFLQDANGEEVIQFSGGRELEILEELSKPPETPLSFKPNPVIDDEFADLTASLPKGEDAGVTPDVVNAGAGQMMKVVSTQDFMASMPNVQASLFPTIARTYVAEAPSTTIQATFFSGSGLVDPLIEAQATSTIGLPQVSPSAVKLSNTAVKTELYPQITIPQEFLSGGFGSATLESFPTEISVQTTRQALFPAVNTNELANTSLLGLGNPSGILITQPRTLLGSQANQQSSQNILGIQSMLSSMFGPGFKNMNQQMEQNILSNMLGQNFKEINQQMEQNLNQQIEQEMEQEMEAEQTSTSPFSTAPPFFDLDDPYWRRNGFPPLALVVPPFPLSMASKGEIDELTYAEPKYMPSLGGAFFNIRMSKKALKRQNANGGALNSGFIRPIID